MLYRYSSLLVELTEERSRVLKIYNWADYIDEDVLAEFPDWYKQQTGEDLRIIYQVFDINEIMLTKIEMYSYVRLSIDRCTATYV